MKLNRDGIMSFVAVKKAPKSPFVKTSNAPTNPINTQNNVKTFGRCLIIIHLMIMEIIGIKDSIMEATIVHELHSKPCPQKIIKLYTVNAIVPKNQSNQPFPSKRKACLPSLHNSHTIKIIVTRTYRKSVK